MSCLSAVFQWSSYFRPVYAGDVARAVEICCRDDPKVVEQVGGKIIEAGGPEGKSNLVCFSRSSASESHIHHRLTSAYPTVFSYREIMQLVLRYSGLQGRRIILSLPYWVGMIQGFFLEKLPESLFTVTRDQVSSSLFVGLQADAVDPTIEERQCRGGVKPLPAQQSGL